MNGASLPHSAAAPVFQDSDRVVDDEIEKYGEVLLRYKYLLVQSGDLEVTAIGTTV